MILAIEEKEFRSLPIIDFNLNTEILDGAGTGRTQAVGWSMFREPQGVIKNIEGEIGLANNPDTNSDFRDFLSAMDDFGKTDFKKVSFTTPSGVITQEMYGASYKLKLKRVDRNGVTYWGTIKFKFIAKEAVSL